MKMQNLMIFIMMLLVVIMTFSVFLALELSKGYSCDIGEINVTGDYTVTNENYFNFRSCAIEDCNAFNEYQEEHNKGDKIDICVV